MHIHLLDDSTRLCLHTPGKIQVYLRSEAETLARAWFKDELGKKRVAETLNQYGFDEYAIEGSTVVGCLPKRLRALVSSVE